MLIKLKDYNHKRCKHCLRISFNGIFCSNHCETIHLKPVYKTVTQRFNEKIRRSFKQATHNAKNFLNRKAKIKVKI